MRRTTHLTLRLLWLLHLPGHPVAALLWLLALGSSLTAGLLWLIGSAGWPPCGALAGLLWVNQIIGAVLEQILRRKTPEYVLPHSPTLVGPKVEGTGVEKTIVNPANVARTLLLALRQQEWDEKTNRD